MTNLGSTLSRLLSARVSRIEAWAGATAVICLMVGLAGLLL